MATQYVMEQDGQSRKLTKVTEEKDLARVIVSSDLKVSRQCSEAVRKASNVLRLIKRHFSRLDKTNFLPRDATQSAVGIATASRLSVRLSVCLSVRDVEVS